MTNWRAIAIMFIIFTIVETLLIVWIFVEGTNIIERENECSWNICEGYDSFLYDDYDRMCYCYIDGEIEHSEYVR